MFHYTNQNVTLSSSHRLKNSTSNARSSSSDVYFHPYNDAPARRAASHHRVSDIRSYSEYQQYHQNHQWDMQDDDDDDDIDDEEEDEPMDILYEQEVHNGRHHSDLLPATHQHHHDYHHHARAHSEPINISSSASNLELQLSTTADHLMALLQREASDYSVPLPVRYYPTEFADVDNSEDGGSKDKKGSSSSSTSIGPWRKRIASWMYDVVDHFQYDRNVVSVALRYIDQYVGYLLVEHEQQRHKRTDSGIGSSRGGGGGSSSRHSSSSSSSSSQPIKRRHFQLIAVTSLYLAIKIHGELMENDPVSGEEYDVVASLVHEVDGRTFLGKPLDRALDNDEDDEEEDSKSSHESDDDLRHVSNKLSELKRRQRKGRWSTRLGSFSLGGGSSSSGNKQPTSHHIVSKAPKAAHSGLPYKPRKRGMLSGPLRLNSFVELSRGLFTSRDIVDTEKKILVALNYIMNPPTSRRFVGELLRMLTLNFTSGAVVDGVGGALPTDVEVLASAAERMLGLDRQEILQKVLVNACAQIEGAASVPSLSIGCLPSILAYGAMVNAIEEEFDKLVSESITEDETDGSMELEKEQLSSPQLEDFQRHYQRYTRNTSPSPATNSKPVNVESDKELFLEAWKEQFLVTVFHATNCFMSPESEDIYKVRELLLDTVAKDNENGGTPSSPTENSKTNPKKRSPRSPRSVVIGNSPNRQMLRGGSFFRAGSSSSTTSLLSPYDSRGRTISSNKDHTASTSSMPRRSYYKQTSEPITSSKVPSMNNGSCLDAAARYKKFVLQTPAQSRRVSANNFDYSAGSSWQKTGTLVGTEAAFQPPNPNCFSA